MMQFTNVATKNDMLSTSNIILEMDCFGVNSQEDAVALNLDKVMSVAAFDLSKAQCSQKQGK